MLAPLPFMVPNRGRLLPGSGRRRPGLRDPPVAGTAAAAGARLHEAAPASPASSRSGGKTPRPLSLGSRSPRVQVRRRAWLLAGGGRRPVRDAAQVSSTAAEAARRCPAGEAGRVEEEPGSPVWNAGLGRARWRRAP